MMDTDHYTLKAFNPEHGLHHLMLEVREVGDDYLLSCKLPVSGELITGQEADCFAALQAVRRKAEGRNWMICCKGARRNVWPSAMSRQMGGGMRMTVAASLAQTRLDSLASLSCSQLVQGLTGTAITRGISETWGVTDGRNTKTLSVTLTIPRKVQRPSYSTVIPCRD